MSLTLLVDDREKAVIPYIENINIEIKRLTIGDYALTYNGHIILCAERKSLKDFAASLKDGRYTNKESMIELRKSEPDVRLFYIIEGQAYPSPNKKFNGIFYKNIESAIFHLMYRDNFLFIETKNPEHTAQKLIRLYESLGRLNELKTLTIGGNDGALTIHIEKKDINIVRALFATFRGVSITMADVFIDAGISILDVIGGRRSIKDLKYNGRNLSKTVHKSFERPLDVLEKMFSKIPGISEKTARLIDTSRLLSYDELAALKSTNGARKLLNKRALENIKKYFEWKKANYESP